MKWTVRYRPTATLVGLLALLLVPTASRGQQSPPAQEDELAPVRAVQELLEARLAESLDSLDVDLIMEGPDFAGTAPAGVRWDGDGERLWFEWKRWDEDETGTWELRAGEREPRRLSEDEADLVPARGAIWDLEHRRALWAVGGAVMLRTEGETHRLVSGLDGTRPVRFTSDGAQAVIRRGNDLLAVPLKPEPGAPALVRLTDIRSGSPPDEDDGTASQEWLREQQLALFDALTRRHAEREQERERREARQAKPLYLRGWEVAILDPSPDLAWVAVSQRREASEDQTADVPDYVTESGYTEDIRARIKVGDEQAVQRVGILHVDSGAVAWLDPGLEERGVAIAGAGWSEDGRRLLVQLRSLDNKDRWFAVVSPSLGDVPAKATESDDAGDDSGADAVDEGAQEARRVEGERQEAGDEATVPGVVLETVLAFHDEDEAWINWSVAGGWGWLPDGESFYLVSERDGWMHLYTVPASGGEPRQLTSGEFEVDSPRLHPDRDAFVFEASIVDPFEVHAYRLPLGGGEPVQLTSGHGREDVSVGPDGVWLAILASSSARPTELYLRRAEETGTGTRVTESPSPAFASYPWVEPQIVHFTASDGTSVPARLYTPDRPHASRPAVIFVHGAGYLHNVHRWWSSYFREYTFHHLLLERGYTVLDIDYRGSAGYGRDWRTAIYRHMGGLDLSDHVDGARYLVREHGVDAERIGIYGGSYGGFITLMALFTEAEHFAAGAALRPVTDWAHYNHPYTSNILNAPQDDAEAYRRSSPIYFADGLEDPLLIAHGVVDTNVHFQGVVRLAQRLIELRKENWELALYPVESHGFVEPASWADEYRRILELFESSLK